MDDEHPGGSGSTLPAVAAVKIDIPRLSTRYVRRPRLISLLEGAVDGQVVLVSAPAGYGKTLVLDDLHELTAADPRHGLAHLVRDRPPTLQLVLATRRDPSLPLGRLRVAGQLCDLRAEALAFSFDEASAMMATADVAVRPDQVRLLLEQTDGWAAGLRLAALSMREATRTRATCSARWNATPPSS